MTRLIRLLPLLSLLLLVGCARWRGGGREPVDKQLRRADALWKRRGEPGQLEPLTQAYLDAYALSPEDPRVLGRLARIYVLHGDLAATDPLQHYGSAKEFGLRCLMLRANFAAQVTAAGGRVSPKAVSQAEDEDLECLAWTTIAWSRIALARGPGMGLDYAVIDAMGARTLALSGADGDGRGALARGLSLAVVPRVMGAKIDEAKAQLEAAAARQPERLGRQVDLAVHGLHRVDKQAEADLLRAVAEAPAPPEGPSRPEDLAAQRRARRLLGMPEPLPGEALDPSAPATPAGVEPIEAPTP